MIHILQLCLFVTLPYLIVAPAVKTILKTHSSLEVKLEATFKDDSTEEPLIRDIKVSKILGEKTPKSVSIALPVEALYDTFGVTEFTPTTKLSLISVSGENNDNNSLQHFKLDEPQRLDFVQHVYYKKLDALHAEKLDDEPFNLTFKAIVSTEFPQTPVDTDGYIAGGTKVEFNGQPHIRVIMKDAKKFEFVKQDIGSESAIEFTYIGTDFEGPFALIPIDGTAHPVHRTTLTPGQTG